MESFGIRLKQLRSERGLTQMQLGEKVNINYSTLSDYERGDKEDPLMSTLRTLANFFNVSLDYMSGESDAREDISTGGTQYGYVHDFNFSRYYEKNVDKAPDFIEAGVTAKSVIFFKPIENVDKINIVLNSDFNEYRFNNVQVKK